MYWFTSDEHLQHHNAIKYMDRPFSSLDEMDEEIIKRHNEIVKSNDIVVHAGDFTFAKTLEDVTRKYINRLNGSHIFVRGSHDSWMNKSYHELWQKKIGSHYICVCHHPMYSWPRSHYGSFLLYGHHHGRLTVPCKAIDVGVDTHNFYPYSMDEVIECMRNKPETPGLIKQVF